MCKFFSLYRFLSFLLFISLLSSLINCCRMYYPPGVTTGGPSYGPGPRKQLSAVYLNGSFYIFGGYLAKATGIFPLPPPPSSSPPLLSPLPSSPLLPLLTACRYVRIRKRRVGIQLRHKRLVLAGGAIYNACLRGARLQHQCSPDRQVPAGYGCWRFGYLGLWWHGGYEPNQCH
jgi:hypothetical protein